MLFDEEAQVIAETDWLGNFWYPAAHVCPLPQNRDIIGCAVTALSAGDSSLGWQALVWMRPQGKPGFVCVWRRFEAVLSLAGSQGDDCSLVLELPASVT